MSEFSNQADQIVITCYADMTKRPRFVPQIDPSTRKLKDVLQEYHLSEETKCALSNCREPHKHGVLIETEDGAETNIGADCAAREFPDRFDAARNSFRLRRTIATHMDVIATFHQAAPTYIERITTAWNEPYGGHWADECRAIFMSRITRTALSQLTNMRRNSDWSLYKSNTVTKDDALGLGYRGSELIERERVGYFRGGIALAAPAKESMQPLLNRIAKYRHIDPKKVPRAERTEWASWAIKIPAAIGDIRSLLSQARECFDEGNLRQLLLITSNSKEKTSINHMIEEIRNINPVALSNTG